MQIRGRIAAHKMIMRWILDGASEMMSRQIIEVCETLSEKIFLGMIHSDLASLAVDVDIALLK